MKTHNSTDEEIKKEIGRRIKQKRRGMRTPLSANTVAKELEISRSALAQIENGKNNVNGVTLWKLATILECTINDFFPVIPDGFGISKRDFEEIAKKDEQAIIWARELFGNPKNDE